MKIENKWTSILFGLLFLTLQLYAQVPNGGFENWTNAEPDQWLTTNSSPDMVTVTQSTTAHSGNYSARGEAISFYNFLFGPSLISWAGNDHGFPISQHYEYLNGYYQFHSTSGTNTMYVSVAEYGISGEDTMAVGGGAIIAGVTGGGYKAFSVKLSLILPSPAPSYCQILFTISDTVAALASVGSYFLVDDLTLSNTAGIATDENSPEVRTFALEQNYPNPFNPETTIRYSIPESGHVLLHVFDITGRTVAVLVDAAQSPGEHDVRWNAGNQAGGIYFYQLISGDQTRTNKMVLLK